MPAQQKTKQQPKATKQTTAKKFKTGRTEVITAAHFKGGSGKTSLLCSLASHYAMADGFKVLFVDLDPQGNGGNFFLDVEASGKPTLSSLLDPDDKIVTSVKDIICHADLVPNIDVLPSDNRLEEIEDKYIYRKFQGKGDDDAKLLAKLLEEVKDEYSLILIDTHPAKRRPLNIMALTASTWFVCPVNADVETFRGLNGLMDIYKEVSAINPALQFLGCVYICYRRTGVDMQAVTELLDTLGPQGHIFSSVISQRSKFVESRRTHIPSIIAEPKGVLAKEYADLAKEIRKKMEG